MTCKAALACSDRYVAAVKSLTLVKRFTVVKKFTVLALGRFEAEERDKKGFFVLGNADD